MNSIAREARIVMPIEATAQSGDLHTEMAKDIARTFGGYTQTVGRGGWVDDDNGELVQEDVVIYDIAVPQQDGAVKLRSLAIRWGVRFEQKAVYIRYTDGVVHILDVAANAAYHAPEEEMNAAVQAFHDRVMKGAPSVALSADQIKNSNTLEAQLAAREAMRPGVTSVPGGVGERVFGFSHTRPMPGVGEVWSTSAGGKAAVVSRASILDGGYNVVMLMPGSTALPIGYAYVVDLDGRVLRGGDENPLDLKRMLVTFALDFV